MRLVQWQSNNTTSQADSPDSKSGDALCPAAIEFDQVFEAYCDRVLKYCFYQLGIWEDAEDTAQRVFEKAFAAWNRFEFKQSDSTYAVRSWIFSIAHNEIANRRRTASRQPTDSLDAADALPDKRPNPEDVAILADNQGRLQLAIAQLTPEMRDVVELRLFGFNDAEIAKLLNRTPGAIRTAQCRAVVQIRSLMGIEITTKGERHV